MIVDNMPIPTSPNDESAISPRLQAPTTFTEFLDGATLAPSPEHPTFTNGTMQGWGNQMDMGMSVDTKEYTQAAGKRASSIVPSIHADDKESPPMARTPGARALFTISH